MLTIFTPTFNRAKTLPRLYQSLCSQTSCNFEWIVVDDGSTDETESLVASWKSEGKVKITYVKQVNSGKMAAHNVGVELCKTELFLCIDSDDWIVPNAVELIIKKWKKENLPKEICGLIAYKIICNGQKRSLKSIFPEKKFSTLHALYQEGFVGDTTLVFRTEVIRKFKFPTFEKFITESYVYDQIDQEYSYLLMREAITVCEYLNDGYTRNSLLLKKKYPKGWAMYYGQYYDFFAKKMKTKIKYAALVLFFSGLSKQSYRMFSKRMSPFICFLCLPALLHYKKIYKENFANVLDRK